MTKPVRILLLEMPQLLRGIFEHAIQTHGDYELLNDTTSTKQVLGEQPMPPDIVIVGLTAADDVTLVPTLFARWPRAQVMTVMPAGHDATVYALRPSQRALGQMSPAEIVETLRDAVYHSRERQQE